MSISKWIFIKSIILCMFGHKWKYVKLGPFDSHYFICKRCGRHGFAIGRGVFNYMPFEKIDGEILTYEKWVKL